MKSLLRAFFAVFLVFCFVKNSYAGKPCDDFVDKVLAKLKEDSSFFEEPYEIPDDAKSIGVYEMEYGHAYGLNSLHRVHDTIAMTNSKGTKHLKLYLGAGELSLQGSFKKKFLSFGKSINVDAKVPFVTMELDVVPNPDGSNPEIQNFKLDEIKGFNVKMSGLGIIRDMLLKVFEKVVTKFFKRTVRQAIEGRLKIFLEKKVRDFPIPAECLDDAWD